jgi:class 3 adenylate cyclase
MTSVIFDYGGTIDKFIGDGIMVMFGAPINMSPQEQVERASQCGLAMQRAVTSFSKDCVARGLPPVRVRVGIHQGEAVVGNFGAEQRADYTCIGPTVNIAARIESSCQPGEVYVSQSVRDQLNQDATREVGSFELKGISAPLTLYQLTTGLELGAAQETEEGTTPLS